MLHVPAASVQLPSVVEFVVSVKVTVPPVGVTAGTVVLVTVAVSTVECVAVRLAGTAATVVCVASVFTVNVTVAVFGLYVWSPEYVAVTADVVAPAGTTRAPLDIVHV
jgi:hypothetical protein